MKAQFYNREYLNSERELLELQLHIVKCLDKVTEAQDATDMHRLYRELALGDLRSAKLLFNRLSPSAQGAMTPRSAWGDMRPQEVRLARIINKLLAKPETAIKINRRYTGIPIGR